MLRVVLPFLCFFFVLGNCGQTGELDEKIVGGRNVGIEEYPYQVSFELMGNHVCGGALIKPNFVLTAAHCIHNIRGYIRYFLVRAGSTRRENGGQWAKVLSICEHPKYNTATVDFDAAVLRLDRALSLSTHVQTIPLQPIGREVNPGTMATVTGWGALRTGGQTTALLRAVDLPKIDSSTCAGFFPRETISARMNCYGYVQGGRDTCQGDSGGPLVVDGRLVGIVSWGYGCADPKRPGVYTNVANWEVNDHINRCMAK